MYHHEIFSAGFSYYSWIRPVIAHILTYRLPHIIKYTGGAGKMNASKISMRKTNFPQCRTININQVDHPVRQSGFFKYAHDHLRAEYLGIGRFPYHYITAECSRC